MMTIDMNTFLPTLLYLCLIILVIVFIVIGIKLIKVIDKTEDVLDEVNKKIDSMNGVFSIVDKTTSLANGISDKIIDGIAHLLSNLFKRKKGNDEDE